MSKKKPRKKPSKPIQEPKEDFWDLGDDDLDLDQVDPPEEKKPVKADSPSSKPPKKTQSEKSSGKKESEETPPEKTEKDDLQKTYQSSETLKTETKLIRKKEAGSRNTQKESPPTTLLEKISLLLLIACLVGALSWGLSAFLREAPQGKMIPFIEDYPAKGEFVTISSVETWWKKPIRTGENADVGIILEANLVPCAKITLSDGGSTTLRVTFRNGEKELIGDTINLGVQDGKFTLTNSDTIEVFSTDGFENASNINSYANEDIDPWSLTITEGNASEEEPLVKARISADSKSQ